MEETVCSTFYTAPQFELASTHWRFVARSFDGNYPNWRAVQPAPGMLYTIAVVLLILWLLGFSFHVAGGLIHLILVVAVVMVVIQLLTGRKV